MYLLSRREFRGGWAGWSRAQSIYRPEQLQDPTRKKKISLLFYDDAKGGLRR